MERNSIFRYVFIVIFTGILSGSAVFSQIDESMDIFDGGVEDGQAILTEYLRPWMNAFSADLSAGWYNTATVHKLGGVDVTFTVNISFVPENAKTFDMSKIGLKNLEPVGSSTIAPTVAGCTDEGPLLEYRAVNATDTVTLASFRSPAGTGYDFVPSPMLQAGIGLPAGTEIIGRLLIPVKVPETSVKMGLWGIGMKHSVSQWIPVLKRLPVGMSLFGGFTRMNVYAGFQLEPDSYDNLENYRPADFTGQEISAIIQAYTIDLIVSTNLPVINVFGGIGYGKTSTDIDVNGNIPIPGFHPDISVTCPTFTDEDIHKIPGMKIANQSGLRFNAGIRLKLAAITLHGDYTWADYSIYTAGIGLSFR
ncbi:MAG TPA: hypothetical protein ENK25_03910 [Bacteroidetes bacterium]|nr:hypothetical protein [Bacteroidota bacterium]